MATQLRVENAVIESTMLGPEDHGILSCFVMVSGDGWGCGFGGYALDRYDKVAKERRGTAYGLEFIRRILTTLEVERWEKLPGTPLRVETDGIGGGITRIGHFRKNRWFSPEDIKDFMEPAKVAR